MKMHTKLVAADSFSSDEITTFKDIVLKEGEVSSKNFDDLIAKNALLLFLDDIAEPSAVGALKIPFDSYKNKVFAKSKSMHDPAAYTHELGWIVSLMRGKGNGNRLMKLLTENSSSIYATVRLENTQMIYLLEKYHFVRSGQAYPSMRGDYQLLLYVLN